MEDDTFQFEDSNVFHFPVLAIWKHSVFEGSSSYSCVDNLWKMLFMCFDLDILILNVEIYFKNSNDFYWKNEEMNWISNLI